MNTTKLPRITKGIANALHNGVLAVLLMEHDVYIRFDKVRRTRTKLDKQTRMNFNSILVNGVAEIQVSCCEKQTDLKEKQEEIAKSYLLSHLGFICCFRENRKNESGCYYVSSITTPNGNVFKTDSIIQYGFYLEKYIRANETAESTQVSRQQFLMFLSEC